MRKVRSLVVFSGIFFFVFAAFGGFRPYVAAAESIEIETEIDIHPESMNPKSKGRWITCIVEAPGEYEADDIVPESVLITKIGEIATDIAASWSDVIDNDDDGVNELMLKYPRADINTVITENELQGEVDFWIDGILADETEFTGSDTVRIKNRKGPKK